MKLEEKQVVRIRIRWVSVRFQGIDRLEVTENNGGRDRTRTCDLLRVKHYGLVRFVEASGSYEHVHDVIIV